MDSPFALAFCQVGAERELKAEVAQLRPDLHPGFQRRGVVTFKCTGRQFSPDEVLPTVYGRGWACSAGPAADADAVLAIAERVGATRLLIGPRELPAADDPAAAQLFAALRASKRFTPGTLRKGDVVLDVVTAPGEAPFVGWHTHHPTRPDAACARWVIPPAEGPSARGYGRMVEGLRWSGIPIKAGEKAIDLAAGTGGATLALLERGACVYAVERQPAPQAVGGLDGVVWVERALSELRSDHLPADAAWIVCDASLPAGTLVQVLRRLVLPLRGTLRGVLVSLQFDPAMTNQELLAQVTALGASEVRAVQLPSNRASFFVFARFEPTGAPPPRRAARPPVVRADSQRPPSFRAAAPPPDDEARPRPGSPRPSGPRPPGPKRRR